LHAYRPIVHFIIRYDTKAYTDQLSLITTDYQRSRCRQDRNPWPAQADLYTIHVCN